MLKQIKTMGNLMKKGARDGKGDSYRIVIPNHLVEGDTEEKSNHRNNKIKTTKYTLLSFFPKNLFEQFHRFANMYFLFIVLLNWIPVVQAFGKEVAMIPLLFVLSVTAVKDAFEDYRRYRSDKSINSTPCMVYSRPDQRYIKKQWAEVQVGDILQLSCNEIIPADIVLLRSSGENFVCHIDTSNVDGETNLKQREVVSGIHLQGADFHPAMFTNRIECEHPNMEVYHFSGSMVNQMSENLPIRKNNLLLRGCIIRNTDFVEGIVVYAGHDTKALLNNRGPRSKRSKLEKQINRDVVWCVVILFIMCFGCALGTGTWLDSFSDNKNVYFIAFDNDKEYDPPYQGFVRFWTYVILYQVMVPLSLYVTIELVKMGQVYFIQNDKELYHAGSNKTMQCRALNITEDLGQIEHIFSDKTGTLTENQMDFKRCTVGGVDYSPTDDSALYEATGKDNDSTATADAEVFPLDNSGFLGMDNLAFIPDTTLRKEVSRMSLNHMEEVFDIEANEQSERIRNFFLLMAICNTVVVSRATDPNIIPLNAAEDVSNGDVFMTDNENNHKNADDVFPLSENIPRLRKYKAKDDMDNGSEIPTSNGHLKIPSVGANRASTLSETTLKMKYEAESPDEMALVKACCSYGCRLVRRSPDTVTVWLPAEGEITIKILHILNFDADRKRMSVIIQHPATNEIILLCKGADSAITPHLRHHPGQPEQEKILQLTQKHLLDYAKQGLRTLFMARRVIPQDIYRAWAQQMSQAENSVGSNTEELIFEAVCNIETDLELLGATGIEDKLQEGVPETIAALREAGISVWILTGDKQETALNIAYSCQLISFDQEVIVMSAKNKEMTENLIRSRLEYLESNGAKPLPDAMLSEEEQEVSFSQPQANTESSTPFSDRPRALVINGTTLKWALSDEMENDFLKLTQFCNSVLCVRATPIQKAYVVKLVRDKLQKLTLSIGDGANDVSMIQTADIGVGISGQEGMQAVMASDFALARFHFLRRLLFVHGHWCYDRLAKMILYMFYKNAVFIFMLLWFQIYNGFSGGVFLDDINLIMFNLVWTSLPPIVLGIFDQDISDKALYMKPPLYKQGPKCKGYRKYSYFIQIADATWQSLVQFFVPYFAYRGGSIGIFEFGVTANTGSVWCALLHCCIETNYWTIFHLLIMVLSLVLFYGGNIILGVLDPSFLLPIYQTPQRIFSSLIHWLCLVLIILMALAPRYVLRTLQNSLWPSPVLRCRNIDRKTHKHVNVQSMTPTIPTITHTGVDSPSSSTANVRATSPAGDDVPCISGTLEQTEDKKDVNIPCDTYDTHL